MKGTHASLCRQVREEELDDENRLRVEARKEAMLAGRAGKFADVQATRIKTMRQLIENRKYVEKHRKLHKPTIVERYANYGSGTYAPLQREGRFPESKPLGKEIETEGYAPVTLKVGWGRAGGKRDGVGHFGSGQMCVRHRAVAR